MSKALNFVKEVKVITNNPIVNERFSSTKAVLYLNSPLEVYEKARSYLYKGYVLLTHPQAGNIPPYKMIYRTLVVGKGSDRSSFSDAVVVDSASYNLLNSVIQKLKCSFDFDKRFEVIKNNSLFEDIKLLDYEFVKDLINEYFK